MASEAVEVPVAVLVRWHQWLLEAEQDLAEGHEVRAYVRTQNLREELEDFNEVLESHV